VNKITIHPSPTADTRTCDFAAEKALFDGMNQPATVFRRIWDTLNAKRGHGWDVNPCVWAVSFEREEVEHG
jgi:hypothetical protein